MAISPLRLPADNEGSTDLDHYYLAPFRLGVTKLIRHSGILNRAAARISTNMLTRTYCVYILSNESRTVYTGVTSDLARGLVQHRSGKGSSFTQLHKLGSLVWYEVTNDVWSAHEREKQIKSWNRKRKLALSESLNPGWEDTSVDLGMTDSIGR